MEDADEFLPGQRWLSETQSDLGLGTVVTSDARHVRIVYPATGETRTYARAGAPLLRVRFGPGDRIRDRDGREMTIHAAEDRAGLLVYRGEDMAGRPCEMREAELDDHLRLNRPREKLFAGRIDRDAWFSQRLATWERGAATAISPVRGLVGPRASLVPHQLYIAAEVAARYAPRVLLADEVGLGKTIEAGLVLHRLILTGQVKRVLVLVPEPLLHQWLVEMLRRFNLRFALFDAERLAAAGEPNPFHSEQLVLCALGLLAGNAAAGRAAVGGSWDLVIVDEAHRLNWSEEEVSPEYALVEALARQTPAVLLLTATPEQLGRAGHFGRLRLLDPHRFPDYGRFLAEERAYAPVAALTARLLDGQVPDPADLALLRERLGDDSSAPLEQLIDRLVDRHGTGRLLFRNTRAAVPGFPGRSLQPHPLPLPDAYAAAVRDPEACLTPEIGGDSDWTAFDPRVDWLVRTLRDLRPAKVLVICARATTVVELREGLARRAGIQAAVFHEDMEIVERDRAAAYFADREAGAQALLCSEIGSEGRNFQFAHHLVLFDLPLDPDLLEQRIGRLDRIGQAETVQVHVPYLQESAGEVAFRWHAQALDAFTAPCPAGSALYRAFRDDLAAALLAPERFAQLLPTIVAERERLNAEIEAGRDRLLEIHSHRPSVSASLVEAVQAQDVDPALRDYMTRFWDLYGVEQDPGAGQSVVLRPGSHMLQEHFPHLPDDGLTVTFDRGSALAHEDRAFLTWEHPMVRDAMELLIGADLGSTAVTALRDARFKPGTLMLEAVYVAECAAPPELQATRFLPPTALRLLIDAVGNERSAEFPHGSLRGICLTRNRKLASALIGSQAERLRVMLERSEALAEQAGSALVAAARRRMVGLLGGELQRLQHLAAANASVRPAELTQLEARRERLARYLEKSSLRLDALRVLVTH